MPRSTGGAEEAGLADGVVRSWMQGNQPFRGLNWSAGIELAFRVISVALAFSIIGIERLDEESCRSAPQIFLGARLLAQAISLGSFLGQQSPDRRACRPDRRPDDGACAARRGRSARAATGPNSSSKSTVRFTRTGSAPSRRRPIPPSPSSCSWSRPLLMRSRTNCRRPPKSGWRRGQSMLCGSWTATGRCRRSAMRTTAGPSQQSKHASQDMWRRSSPRLQTALAARTSHRQGPIQAFAACCSDLGGQRLTRAQACASSRRAVIPCSAQGRGACRAHLRPWTSRLPVNCSPRPCGHARRVALARQPADFCRRRHLSLPLTESLCEMPCATPRFTTR